MSSKKAIRCQNNNVHRHGNGRLLLIFDGDSIYVHCKHSLCKKWTRLKVDFDGVNVDFSKAAIIQDTLPDDYHFDIDLAPAIVGDD